MAPRTVRRLWMLVAITACAAVFAMYAQPDFVVRLADQLWACF